MQESGNTITSDANATTSGKGWEGVSKLNLFGHPKIGPWLLGLLTVAEKYEQFESKHFVSEYLG